MINFLLNNKHVSIETARPDLTLLEYLREQQGLCGTKEGCASGDCGACTVAIAQPNEQGTKLEYKAINSCVTFLSALQGKQLITVEHLSHQGVLHPVQQALVDHHGSQCGFCTPGFVMSMFCLFHQDKNHPVNHLVVENALSGNLCRCTGYRPIVDAALSSCGQGTLDKFDQQQQTTLAQLASIDNHGAGVTGLFMPQSRQALREIKQLHPAARLFAGSTDLALESTQLNTDLTALVSLNQMPALNRISEDEQGLTIGAAVPFAKLEQPLLKHFPRLKELLWRFASTPIRNQASLGGNVANASPIGDMPPALLALNAVINLDDGLETRQVDAKAFFTGYRQTQMRAQEWIDSITIPFIPNNSLFRAYKVSKRIEDDISAVCAVFNLSIDEDNQITALACGFGGVAATPATAATLSQALLGLNWNDQHTMLMGKEILISCFSPIDDVRASAQYRNNVLANLWQRFWLETAPCNISIQTRVHDYA